MAMCYLAGKLRAPAPAAAALRRPRSLSANASQSQGKYTNGSTTELASSMKVVKNVDETIRQLHEEVAKMEAATQMVLRHDSNIWLFSLFCFDSKEIAEIIRYNRFHRRCIMGSVVLGVGLAGASCVWYTRSYRKALREYYVVGLEMEPGHCPLGCSVPPSVYAEDVVDMYARASARVCAVFCVKTKHLLCT